MYVKAKRAVSDLGQVSLYLVSGVNILSNAVREGAVDSVPLAGDGCGNTIDELIDLGAYVS